MFEIIYYDFCDYQTKSEILTRWRHGWFQFYNKKLISVKTYKLQRFPALWRGFIILWHKIDKERLSKYRYFLTGKVFLFQSSLAKFSVTFCGFTTFCSKTDKNWRIKRRRSLFACFQYLLWIFLNERKNSIFVLN